MRKKRRLTIDFREMRSEFTEESIVNNGLLFMKNCFPYCLLEIIVGGQNQQGGHKPGKHGKLREFEKLSESQGKRRENSGKSQFLK